MRYSSNVLQWPASRRSSPLVSMRDSVQFTNSGLDYTRQSPAGFNSLHAPLPPAYAQAPPPVPLPPPTEESVTKIDVAGPRPPPSHRRPHPHIEQPPPKKKEHWKEWKARETQRETVIAATRRGNFIALAVFVVLAIIPVIRALFLHVVMSHGCQTSDDEACLIWPHSFIAFASAVFIFFIVQVAIFDKDRWLGKIPSAAREGLIGRIEYGFALKNSILPVLVFLFVSGRTLLFEESMRFTSAPLALVSPASSDGFIAVLPEYCSTTTSTTLAMTTNTLTSMSTTLIVPVAGVTPGASPQPAITPSVAQQIRTVVSTTLMAPAQTTQAPALPMQPSSAADYVLSYSGACSGGVWIQSVVASNEQDCYAKAKASGQAVTYFTFEGSGGGCAFYSGVCSAGDDRKQFNTYKIEAGVSHRRLHKEKVDSEPLPLPGFLQGPVQAADSLIAAVSGKTEHAEHDRAVKTKNSDRAERTRDASSALPLPDFVQSPVTATEALTAMLEGNGSSPRIQKQSQSQARQGKQGSSDPLPLPDFLQSPIAAAESLETMLAGNGSKHQRHESKDEEKYVSRTSRDTSSRLLPLPTALQGPVIAAETIESMLRGNGSKTQKATEKEVHQETERDVSNPLMLPGILQGPIAAAESLGKLAATNSSERATKTMGQRGSESSGSLPLPASLQSPVIATQALETWIMGNRSGRAKSAKGSDEDGYDPAAPMPLPGVLQTPIATANALLGNAKAVKHPKEIKNAKPRKIIPTETCYFSEDFLQHMHSTCFVFEKKAEAAGMATIYFGGASILMFVLGAIIISAGEIMKLRDGQQYWSEQHIDLSLLLRQSSVLAQSPAFREMQSEAKHLRELTGGHAKSGHDCKEEDRPLIKKHKTHHGEDVAEIREEILVGLDRIAFAAVSMGYISRSDILRLYNYANCASALWPTILQIVGYALWIPLDYIMLAPCLGIDARMKDAHGSTLSNFFASPFGIVYLQYLHFVFALFGIASIAFLVVLTRKPHLMNERLLRCLSGPAALVIAILWMYYILCGPWSLPKMAQHAAQKQSTLGPLILFLSRYVTVKNLLFLTDWVEVAFRLTMAFSPFGVLAHPSAEELQHFDNLIERDTIMLIDGIGDASQDDTIRKSVARLTFDIAEQINHLRKERVKSNYKVDVTRPLWICPPEPYHALKQQEEEELTEHKHHQGKDKDLAEQNQHHHHSKHHHHREDELDDQNHHRHHSSHHHHTTPDSSTQKQPERLEPGPTPIEENIRHVAPLGGSHHHHRHHQHNDHHHILQDKKTTDESHQGHQHEQLRAITESHQHHNALHQPKKLRQSLHNGSLSILIVGMQNLYRIDESAAASDAPLAKNELADEPASKSRSRSKGERQSRASAKSRNRQAETRPIVGFDAYVSVLLGDLTVNKRHGRTHTESSKNTNPRWMRSFDVPVQSVHDDLIFEIRDEKGYGLLGHLALPIHQLATDEAMTIKRPIEWTSLVPHAGSSELEVKINFWATVDQKAECQKLAARNAAYLEQGGNQDGFHDGEATLGQIGLRVLAAHDLKTSSGNQVRSARAAVHIDETQPRAHRGSKISKKSSRYFTDVIRNSSSPAWQSQSFLFPIISRTSELVIEVVDEKDELFMGRSIIPLQRLIASSKANSPLILRQGLQDVENVPDTQCGHLELEFTYALAASVQNVPIIPTDPAEVDDFEFRVSVIRASQLRGKKTIASMKVFATAHLEERPSSKRASKMLHNKSLHKHTQTLDGQNPVWNSTAFVFPAKHRSMDLVFEVCSEGPKKMDSFLGRLVVPVFILRDVLALNEPIRIKEFLQDVDGLDRRSHGHLEVEVCCCHAGEKAQMPPAQGQPYDLKGLLAHLQHTAALAEDMAYDMAFQETMDVGPDADMHDYVGEHSRQRDGDDHTSSAAQAGVTIARPPVFNSSPPIGYDPSIALALRQNIGQGPSIRTALMNDASLHSSHEMGTHTPPTKRDAPSTSGGSLRDDTSLPQTFSDHRRFGDDQRVDDMDRLAAFAAPQGTQQSHLPFSGVHDGIDDSTLAALLAPQGVHNSNLLGRDATFGGRDDLVDVFSDGRTEGFGSVATLPATHAPGHDTLYDLHGYDTQKGHGSATDLRHFQETSPQMQSDFGSEHTSSAYPQYPLADPHSAPEQSSSAFPQYPLEGKHDPLPTTLTLPVGGVDSLHILSGDDHLDGLRLPSNFDAPSRGRGGPSEAEVEQLMGMGFTRDQCIAALASTSNMEQALDALLSGAA